jgi:hypothetical protein
LYCAWKEFMFTDEMGMWHEHISITWTIFLKQMNCTTWMKLVHGWKYVKNEICNIYEVDDKDETNQMMRISQYWWIYIPNIKSPPSTMDDDEWKSLTSNHGLCEAYVPNSLPSHTSFSFASQHTYLASSLHILLL